jgi:F-type H+-transporting ATPase subunit a
MRIFQRLLPCLLMLPPAGAWAAGAEGGHHGLPPNAPVVLDLGFFKLTNSGVYAFIVAAVVIVVAQLSTRNLSAVPGKLQNFVEWLVESLYGFFEGILGPKLVKQSFWFFASVFLFILFSNWFGLLPGVGTVGWGSRPTGTLLGIPTFGHLDSPLFRGVNADLNMTSAMAVVFMVLWFFWAVGENGVGGFIKHIFAPKGKVGGFMGVVMVVIFLFVGVIEVISIAFRPVSLSFRLFGNIFAGENLLEAMLSISAWFGWLIALPFYFLELIVGLVQALVFALLTSVFTALMFEHDDHGHDHGDGDAAHAKAH